MHVKTFKYLLYPTTRQEKLLDQAIDICRNFHNMCLVERKLAWEIEKRNVNKFEQMKTVPFFRKSFRIKVITAQSLQSVCNDLDKSFKAFFRRVKTKQKAGYPRFKGKNQFRSINFPQYANGIKIDGRRLKLFNVGRVAVRWDRPIEGTIKTVRIIRNTNRYYAAFTCEVRNEVKLPKSGNKVGIDLNIENILTDSNGKRIENPKYYYKAQRKLRIAQRSLQRKKKNSNNRKKSLIRLQKLHEHIKNQKKDLHNKVVHEYNTNNDVLILEDLEFKNLIRNRNLRKSILDASWSYFKRRLLIKAANAGREVILVNPYNTSKICSQCDKIFRKMNLNIRWVKCSCGLSIGRDHNAAINILNRGIAGWDASVEQNTDSSQCALEPFS